MFFWPQTGQFPNKESRIWSFIFIYHWDQTIERIVRHANRQFLPDNFFVKADPPARTRYSLPCPQFPDLPELPEYLGGHGSRFWVSSAKFFFSKSRRCRQKNGLKSKFNIYIWWFLAGIANIFGATKLVHSLKVSILVKKCAWKKVMKKPWKHKKIKKRRALYYISFKSWSR